MDSLIKYNGEYLQDSLTLLMKTQPNAIFEIIHDKQIENFRKSPISFENSFSICIMGDGAVENSAIRTSLQQSALFGDGYFEQILNQAYQKRMIYDVVKFYEVAKDKFERIITGINNILICGIYNFTDEEISKNRERVIVSDGKNVFGIPPGQSVRVVPPIKYVGASEDIPCDPSFHNQKNLQSYKDILQESLDKINLIISVYTGEALVSEIINISTTYSWFSKLSLPLVVGRMLSPLDWSQQLRTYHKLPTEFIPYFSLNYSAHKRLPDIFKKIEAYNNFILRLAEVVNQPESQLRKIPEVILKDIDNTWFLSLNWCNSDINNSTIRNLIKLHGSCQSIDSMVLPTQEIRDSKKLCEFYVPSISMNILGLCTTLYLWGVSLTDYDVEVHYFIFNSLIINPNIKQIIVINPDKQVYDKVRNLIKIYKIEDKMINVGWINPIKLDQKSVLTKFMTYRSDLFCKPHGLKVTLPIYFNDSFDSQLRINTEQLNNMSREFGISISKLEYFIQRLQAIHILSLTRKCARNVDSDNMWGLYADSGKGMAFEFNYTEIANRLDMKPLKKFLIKYYDASNKEDVISKELTDIVYDYIIAIIGASRQYYLNCKRVTITFDHHPELHTTATEFMGLTKNTVISDQKKVQFLKKLLSSECFTSILKLSTCLYEVTYTNDSNSLIHIFNKYYKQGEAKESQLDSISEFMSTKNILWQYEAEYRVLISDYTATIIKDTDSLAKDNPTRAKSELIAKISENMHFIYFSSEVKYEAVSVISRDIIIEAGIIPKIYLPYPQKIYLGWNFDIESIEGKHAYNKIKQFCEEYKIELIKLKSKINYKNNQFDLES